MILHHHFTNLDSDVPPKTYLHEISGFIEWTEQYDYGVRFKFYSDERLFVYMSKFGEHEKVSKALRYNQGSPIYIFANLNDTIGPVYSEKRYHVVYEISKPNQMIRSHSQVSRSFRDDNKIAPFVGLGFTVFGYGFFIVIVWKLINKRKKV